MFMFELEFEFVKNYIKNSGISGVCGVYMFVSLLLILIFYEEYVCI